MAMILNHMARHWTHCPPPRSGRTLRGSCEPQGVWVLPRWPQLSATAPEKIYVPFINKAVELSGCSSLPPSSPTLKTSCTKTLVSFSIIRPFILVSFYYEIILNIWRSCKNF